MKTFGEKLKELIDERNMLQSEMAELLGVSRKTIIEYENGNCKPIRKNLIKYAQILEVPVEYLRDDRYNTPLEVFNKPSPEVLGMDAERRKAVSPNAISEMEFIKERGTALLAGGELSEDLKEELFRCMYVAYLEGKGKMND